MRRGEPLYFGPAARPLFGWLHRAAAPARVGLVVCNPFGYEAICVYRALRHFADAAAGAGVPALRFDYDGTGDSAGHDREPARLAAWVASVHHAVDALRRHGTVDEVVLLGVRLGALIATLAAVERDDVVGLVAVAPVVTGKAHLRELRALQMSVALPPTPPGVAVEDGVQSALGFPLTAETKSALAAVDLTRLARAPAPAALVLARDDLPLDEAWPRHLAALGVAVDHRRMPGYVDMVLGAEHARVPEPMVRATVEWLSARRAAAPPTTAVASPRPLAWSCLPDLIEAAAHVDDARRLFGVLSTPAAPPRARRGVLLLNAGAVHHIGPNRLYVTLARRWAALGHAVLRLDVAGIGDSPPLPGQRENVVYTDGALHDVEQGLAFLRRQPGVTEVVAVGLCSGAYNAFKAAVAGAALDGLVLINPLTFFYKADQPLGDAEHQIIFEASRYLRRLRDGDAWRRALRNGVDLRAAARTLSRFVVDRLRGRARELGRRAGLPMGDDLARELTAIAARRIPLRFVFSAGDPGLALLQTHGGPTVEKLRRAGQLSIEIIDGADHTFTPLWSHEVLTSALDRLDALPHPRR